MKYLEYHYFKLNPAPTSSILQLTIGSEVKLINENLFI